MNIEDSETIMYFSLFYANKNIRLFFQMYVSTRDFILASLLSQWKFSGYWLSEKIPLSKKEYIGDNGSFVARYHRMTWVGKDLKDHQAPVPLLHLGLLTSIINTKPVIFLLSNHLLCYFIRTIFFKNIVIFLWLNYRNMYLIFQKVSSYPSSCGKKYLLFHKCCW